MAKKLLINTKGALPKLGSPQDKIRPFIFRMPHLLIMVVIGVLLVVPSASVLVKTAIPFSWERVPGAVSTVSQNEAATGRAQYTATIAYRLNNQTYSVRETYVGERPSRDDGVVVYYNPKIPGDAMVERGGRFTFLAWIPLVLGSILLAIAGFQQYKAMRRSNRIKNLKSNGESVSAVVVEVEVLKEKSFLQELFYGKYIFFKLKAAPEIDGAGMFQSELLMWRSKMYGDVDTIKEEKTPLALYHDKSNTDSYYLEPPVAPGEMVPAADSPEDKDNDESNSENFLHTVRAGFIDEPADEFSAPLEDETGFNDGQAKPYIPSEIGTGAVSATFQDEAVDLSAPDKIEADLDTADIDQLERSLAGINASPVAIDLNFTDDPENINNTTDLSEPLDLPLVSQSPVDVSIPQAAPQVELYPDATLPPTPTVPPAPPIHSIDSSLITGMSSVASIPQPETAAEVSPAVNQTSTTNPNIAISPITNISESIEPQLIPSLPEPTPTPVPTPAPVLSRAEVANAAKSGRRVSVPRR